jgi:site-specific recombinase XerD
VFFAGKRLTAEVELIERKNFFKFKAYLLYLVEVMQVSQVSVDRYRFYLRHFLIWAGEKLLGEIASIRPTFPAYIASLPGKDGKGSLAAETQKKIIDTSKRFLRWAKATSPIEFTKLPSSFIESLHPLRSPELHKDHEYVSLDEVSRLAILQTVETDLAIMRDKAAAAMLFLSGMRASAFTTMPIQAVDLPNLSIRQWPELGVRTKNGKMATTYLLPIPGLLEVVSDWDSHVRSRLADTERLYAPIDSNWGDQSLSSKEAGKNRHQALDKRLKNLFALAGLPYMSAHKFRHGHAVYGLQHAATIADYKAVSMNLMHEDIKITDSIYAPMLSNEVQSRISRLTDKQESHPGSELAAYLNHLSKAELAKAVVIIGGRMAAESSL